MNKTWKEKNKPDNTCCEICYKYIPYNYIGVVKCVDPPICITRIVVRHTIGQEKQVKPNIDQHDLETKLKRAQGFLDKGKRVRFHMKFRGRERTHSEIGMDMMNDIIGRCVTNFERYFRNTGDMI